MTSLPYLINFSLGDWSGDGHAIHEEFIIESNLPVEELRELHFKFEELYNIDIGSLCSECSWLTRDTVNSLIMIGALETDILLNTKTKNFYVGSTKVLLNLWLKCLQAVNPEFKHNLKIIPYIHFAGYDNKRRHLGVPGYGLFE